MMKLPKSAVAGALLLVTVTTFIRVVDGTSAADRIDATGPGLMERAQQEPITPIPQPPPGDPKQSALGEQLFHDVRLSGQGDRSCASCHDLATNGARSTPPGGEPFATPGRFDTISIFNSALNFRLNWLGHFRSLEEQAEASLRNQQAMDADIDIVLDRLNADREIRRQFLAAYGKAADRVNLLDALASFERGLLTPESRFDRWLLGDRDALSAQELAGYQLFKTLGCISCHQGVNVGGNLYQKPGVFERLTTSAPAFVRVPSLRNVAATAPYFHDGSAETLDVAIRRMARAQLNTTIDGKEVEDLKAFLGTLTGLYRGQPVRPAE
jgi:cytochrome c peroxidase